MDFKKKVKTETTTFKSLIINMVLFIISVHFVGGRIANRGFRFSILATISSLLGTGISITTVYYFLNNKSFKPIAFPKVVLLFVLALPLVLIISIGVYYGLDFIMNLF